ncbi:MAG TPA: ATP-binding cassette domain-containing protein, partial [Acidimicrobiales bacterium]|nr:ATP-binding cassette domain-containing protein [Acidimicrobiales bacterium]
MTEVNAERRRQPGDGDPRLDARGLTKRFGRLTVLRDVSLRIGPGEVVALVGENGAGKSTLVSCLARIIEPEEGDVRVDGGPLPSTPDQVRRAGLEVLWQDHGLCDDLDVVANVFLGREPGRWMIAESDMREGTASVLRRVGADTLPLDRPVRGLSRGQRQLVALARALWSEPRLLLLDEPTASLGVIETRRVREVIRQRRDAGAGILLVTHDLDLVFALADRVVVLRDGRVMADVSPLEVHRDDIVALMSGIEMDSMARRQLQRLRSLVDQLSDVEPAASLPLIVSAMAAALDQEMLCVHLLEAPGEGEAWLRRTAAVGLPPPLLEVNERLELGAEGGCAGLAAARAASVVVEDLWAEPGPERYRRAAAASGIRSEWAAPIVGAHSVLGTVSGFATSVGGPEPAQLELARLYLGYVAAAIERERLLAEVSRRNRILESLRNMLETLAGPDRVVGGLAASSRALRGALGAAAVGVLIEQGDDPALLVADGDGEPATRARFRDAARLVLADDPGRGARFVEPDLAAVALRHPEGRAVLVAHLPATPTPADTLELLDDATRSLALAMEGEALEHARREAAALRRSQAIQRELLSSLSHELRTPLTAIQGFASTLLQPDLTWDAASTDRFLRSIAAEGARLERLVGDLLDASSIESGVLSLQRHWCDLALVVETARRLVAGGEAIRLHAARDLDPVWGDHDRLEQVFVNLLENAVTHGASRHGVDVTLRRSRTAGSVVVEVADHGPGIPPRLAERVFQPRVRAGGDVAGAGLGLSIARGIVVAHGGTLVAARSRRGARLVVTLPCEPPRDAAEAPPDGAWN